MSRMRSPNFPSIPLEHAIRAARTVWDNNRRSVIMREDAAKDMGYTAMSGRALSVLGALNQYGLVENVSKGQLRVTKRAEDIFHGYPEDVKLTALHEASNAPALYSDIYERFEGAIPGDNAVRSFLFQKGFTNEGVEKALRAFLETNRYVEIAGASESYRAADQSAPDSPPLEQQEEEQRPVETVITPAPGAGKSGITFFRQGPLDFSLTSNGIALTGNTNSAADLKAFIERLKVLAAVLPDTVEASDE
ncbi:hypothetical protein SPAN111604_07990 [Sphingomonas antarctica]|uniref:hypothetical protein n=1 Tax=Sphingomonas antarctica TaxID=2040274 RepID=UPI0039EAD488